MTGLGLIGKPVGPQPCTLYFAVPPDVYPVYQHKLGSMVPAGSALPGNVALMVLEIDLPQQQLQAAAAVSASSSSTASAGSKRKLKAQDANSLLPPSKKAADTKCNCHTGCTKASCKCFKNGNKCGSKCHKAATPASAAMCSNC